MKYILLLEDTEDRVKWLRPICEARGAELVVAARVNEFIRTCREHMLSDVRALVLDHDLGGYAVPTTLQDADGLDGLDAVEQMPILQAPVIVWSSNDQESPKMVSRLRERGFITVERMPWYDDRNKIVRAIARCLR